MIISNPDYTTIKHPRSGETFAARYEGDILTHIYGVCPCDEDGNALDPIDLAILTPEMLEDWFANIDREDIDEAAEDAIAWRAAEDAKEAYADIEAIVALLDGESRVGE